MSETTTETPAEPVAATETPAATPPAEPPAPKPTETVEFWKQKAREQENRAKANASAAERLKEIEDRDLSDLQKAQRDAEEARTQLADVQATALRQRIALEKGLPAEIAATLSGATEEDLSAYADRLIAWRGDVPPATPAAPRPDPSQGAHTPSQGTAEDAEYDQYYPTQPRT